jgi:hypothetical protein
MDHQLRGVIGLRLEQHGVHVGMRRHAAGHGLQRLRPADSPPSTVTAALFDMFCGLNGRT